MKQNALAVLILFIGLPSLTEARTLSYKDCWDVNTISGANAVGLTYDASTGTLLVVDGTNNQIDVYSTAGTLISSHGLDTTNTSATGVTLFNSDRYVSDDPVADEIFRYDSAYTFLDSTVISPPSGDAQGIAFDTLNGNAFLVIDRRVPVDNENFLDEYTTSFASVSSTQVLDCTPSISTDCWGIEYDTVTTDFLLVRSRGTSFPSHLLEVDRSGTVNATYNLSGILSGETACGEVCTVSTCLQHGRGVALNTENGDIYIGDAVEERIYVYSDSDFVAEAEGWGWTHRP